MNLHCTEIENYSIESKIIANRPGLLKYIWMWITCQAFIPLYYYRIKIDFKIDVFSNGDVILFEGDEWLVEIKDGKTFIENLNPIQFRGIGNNIFLICHTKKEGNETN